MMNLIIRILNRLKYELNLHTAKVKWYTIPAGKLIGTKIYVKKEINSMWNNMSLGIYDKFIYNKLDALGNHNGSTFWDVGAHVGFHSLGFASITGKSGKVIAFEPNPFNRERLNVHIKANPDLGCRIEICELALSNHNGEAKFCFSNDVENGQSSGGFISEIIPPLGSNSYTKFVETNIPTQKADDLVNSGKYRAPQIMKIDVEGAESIVLKGSYQILLKFRPVLFIEVHTIIQMLEVSNLLIKLDYQIEILDKENAENSRCFIAAIHPNGYNNNERN